ETGVADLELERHLRLRGLDALSQAVDGVALDFCVVHSTLAATLGGLGLGAYAAAAAAAELAVRRHNLHAPRPWLGISWGGVSLPDDVELGAAAGRALDPDAGVRAFAGLLGLGDAGQVLVSVTDLGERVARWQSPGEPASAALPSQSPADAPA